MSTRVVNRGESTATTASFTLSGDLFELPAGPLGFAGVLEWASQEYDLNADPRILPTYTTDAPDKPPNLTGTGGGGERDRSSGERRGGKECVRTCRHRGSPQHSK